MSDTIRLEFLSDWAIGSGHAAHDAADSLVRRDADGLPYVPGKTLAGMLRDSCEQVAAGLDNGTAGVWDQWVRFLWGSGQSSDHDGCPGVIAVPSLRVPSAARTALLSDPRLLDAAVTTRFSVSIDKTTGIAEHRMLRLLERARAGWTYEGELDALIDPTEWSSLPCADVPGDWPTGDPLWPARFLLAAGVRRLTRLGSDRRRGIGRVKATYTSDLFASDGKTWQALLRTATRCDDGPGKAIPRPTGPRHRAVSDRQAPWAADAMTTARWQRFLVTVDTAEPVLARARVIGNTVIGHDHIPGATLLPVVARSLEDAGSHVIDGSLIVTDATPGAGADRSVPTPCCLEHLKVRSREDAELFNAMRRRPTDSGGHPVQTVGLGDYIDPAKPKSVADAGAVEGTTSAVGSARSAVRTRRMTMVTTMHNTIDDERQRPDDNGLYAYKAIASGSRLTFEILLRDAAAVDAARLVPARTRIGGSTSAEYGLVALSCRKAPAKQTFAGSGGIDAGEEFTIWLTSPLIPDGRPDASGLLSTLGAALGSALHLADDSASPSLMARTVRRDSWQARWGLPRPSLVAYDGGTVLRVTADDAVAADRIREIEAAGIGDRRSEGFGRVLIAPPLLAADRITIDTSVLAGDAEAPSTDSTAPADRPVSEPEPSWLAQTRLDACQAALTDACWAAAANPDKLLPDEMSRAQAGRLRAAAEEALRRDALKPLGSWATSVGPDIPTRVWGDTYWEVFTDPRRVLDTLEVQGSVGPLLVPLPQASRDRLLRQAVCMLALTKVRAHGLAQAAVTTDTNDDDTDTDTDTDTNEGAE